MNKEVNDNLNKNTSQEDIEFLTTAVPIIKDLNDEQIEMLTTSLPVIKDYTEEEINELIKKIPTLKKEDIAKIVIMPGDPLRAKFIAETYLNNYTLVSRYSKN